MAHLFNQIANLDDDVLEMLAVDARNRAESSSDPGYQLKQVSFAKACENELQLRKNGEDHGSN